MKQTNFLYCNLKGIKHLAHLPRYYTVKPDLNLKLTTQILLCINFLNKIIIVVQNRQLRM